MKKEPEEMNRQSDGETPVRKAFSINMVLGLTLGAVFALPVGAQEVLPFPPKPSGSVAERTMQESTYSPLPPVSHLSKDAPNILIVLIDDVGPGQCDTYGGEVHTPTLSKLAQEGISYNRFHTTAMCSPTRAALLTGRNHHRVARGQITELANDWDGYMGTIPKSSAPILTANWEADSDERWTVPIGGGVGKIIHVGKQPLNLQLQAYYNVVTPDTFGVDWQLRFQVQLLFPK